MLVNNFGANRGIKPYPAYMNPLTYNVVLLERDIAVNLTIPLKLQRKTFSETNQVELNQMTQSIQTQTTTASTELTDNRVINQQ